MSKPLKAFITYSHKNRKAKDRLIECLKGMQREGLISIWHDNEIIAGDKWREEIFETNLPDSDLLLYLVSASSLESENCNRELGIALEKNIRPILIILEDCDWKNYKLSNVQTLSTEGYRFNEWASQKLSDIQALPTEVKPLNEWNPRSKGWQTVVGGLRKAIQTMQSPAKSALQQGNFWLTLRQIDKAIESYSRAIKLNPNYANAYNNRGVAHDKQGEVDRAIEDFNIAIELNPNYAGAYTNRGGAYGKKEEHDRAIEDCNKAIQLNSDDLGAYYNRGTAYGKKGDVDRAITDFTKAIEFKPDESDIFNNRGVAYKKKGEVDCAIADFTRAIQLNPDDPDIYYNRGAAYGEKGNVDHAVADFTKVIELNPDDAEAFNNRGAAYGIKGEVDRAIADFNKAIALNPNLANFYNNRGKAYFQRKDYDRAIIDYTKAIQLNPDCSEAYYGRGAAYREKRDCDRAIRDFTNVIQLNPNNAELYYIRGVTHSDKDDHERAIEDYTKAIQLNPDYAEAYHNRGLAYGIKGEYNRAITDFTKAIDFKPDYPHAYFNRGLAYDIKGEHDLAIKDYTKAIQLKPDDANAYHNCGSAYGAKGDFDHAIENFTRAIELKPAFAEAFYSRGVVWLYLREWESAKSDLTSARDKGLDIVAAFHNDYKNVEAYERANRVKLPRDIAAMLTQRRRSRFPRTQKFSSSDGTPFESPDVLNLLTKLRNAGTPLSEYIQTRPTFGLKTGRQEAFVVDGGTRDQLIAEHASSVDILKPFLHGRDIRRWQVARPNSWLIFTYRGIEINRYPAIQRHLEKYTASLNERAGKQKWYELPTAKRDAGRFTQTKLVCPNLYNHQNFAVDTEGFYCGDTCYLIPNEEAWLCGLLNSCVVEWFYSHVSKQLTEDYLRARSHYMQQIPIPDLTSTQKAVIAKIVDYLIYLQGQPTTNSEDLAHARDAVMLKYFERIIDGLVYESYLREDLHHGDKQFFKPLLDERLPQLEEIRDDKMSALQEIFERLYERTHPIRRNLFFLDSVKPIRIIEGKA